jgi:UDP:flavonoid glycosyltransferase YjiC (YdhE family)
MARILVATLPFAGHVGATAAVTGELTRRGHEVVAYTGAKYGPRFEAVGATWLPRTRATDFDDADLAATFPEIGDGKGFRADRANGELILFGTAAGQAQDILAEAAREPFDLLVVDQTAFGGALAGERLGVPWATIPVTPLSLTSRDLPPLGTPMRPATGPLGRARDAAFRPLARTVYRRVVDPRLNKMRAAVGLGPVSPPAALLDSLYSPHLVLAQGVPGLEYPRSDLPASVHFVGRLAAPPTAGSDLPPWWPEVAEARAAGRPIVHVTQGTLHVDPADLLKPTIAGLAGQGVLVVATTGGAPPSVLGPLPANARAAPFLPHDLLLPAIDVMVTNGGWGGVLAALQAGVPLVVAGATLDKPEVARRVAWSGAGVNLRTGSPSAAKVGGAVREVLGRPEMRQRARELGAAITAAGGVPAATTLIEHLLYAPEAGQS